MIIMEQNNKIETPYILIPVGIVLIWILLNASWLILPVAMIITLYNAYNVYIVKD